MMHSVIVIGGGVAGMEAALTLKNLGIRPLLVEKDDRLGGKINLWDRLFPTRTPAAEVLGPLVEAVKQSGIEVRTGAPVETIDTDGRGVVLSGGQRLTADAVVVASGYDLFDATRKEEYGYGIYDNVITSPELEAMFREHRVVTSHGTVPKRVALLHCVGSRDEKVGQNHCSRVCCITGIKQAIEIRELYPECEVFNFYMDMRMFGAGYEEMYRASQEKYGVNHIRGRISEVSETIDGRIQLKTEDTLVGRPMRMTADLLVLLVGMCCGAGNIRMAGGNGLELRPTGFFLPKDSFRGNVSSKNPRIFFAGTASAPKNVGESINEGRAAAYGIYEMLKNV